jgi:hypothetical protein
MGDAHEADIAEWTKGIKQKASGSQWHRQGDTKNGEFLVSYPITSDGKSTMGKSIAISRDMWNKITDQTFNQHPALFLRFYRPATTTPLTVDLDLAVIRAGLFTDLLEAARKWAAIEEEIGDDAVVSVDYVINLMRIGRDEQDRKFRDLVQLGQEIQGDAIIRVEHSGCDCCR